jgi:alanine racemase
MTHLACADERDSQIHDLQQRRWHQLLEVLNSRCPKKLSVANSAALLSGGWLETHSIRPGIALYGCSPFQDQQAEALGLIPVSRFYSQVIAIQDLVAGETVGYGGVFTAQTAMRIGILAVGYGDGYPRQAPSGTPVLISGRKCALVGRVSMDMLAVDLTALPEAVPGMVAELWGVDLPIEHVARCANTIGYELYCQLSHRVNRYWID